MILLVLVAHDGKTLQLEVSGQTRVDAVQQALVSVTGISLSDQIVMCHGARLDAAKPLAAYKLPVADAAAAEDTPVFLYHKAYLRPGAAPPAQEPLPMLEVAVPSMPHVGLRHPLHAAHSPLIRALPDYEAQFTQQLGEARAFLEASQQRLNRCRQLMSEQEVQARAADAARANVESHYNYIASIYATFVDKYVAQHRQHSALLSQFGELSAALTAVALPPQLATQQWRVLADLQPRVKLAEWHESCSRSHEQFAQKVCELEGVFQLLRGDVERLFLQAPRVDLDALGQQLAEAEGMVDEQASIVQVLSKDLDTVRSLVEAVVAQLGSSAGGASLSGAAVHDSCAAVDTLLEQHLHSLLPRVRACDTSVAEFLLRCGEAKACMTRDVLEQLQGIAAQQSRIRDMKHKLALLNEVLSRQAAAFAELQAANRLPAAYRLALAECARRAAWREMYAAQAARLAEHCGRITAKEGSKREAVNRQLERYLPHGLLEAAGLLQEPPHCTVSLPPSDAFLLPVSPADIARLPAAIQAAADAAAAADRPASQTGDVAAVSASTRISRHSAGDTAAASSLASPSSRLAGGSGPGSRSSTPSGASAPGAASMAASTAMWLQRCDAAASTIAATAAGAPTAAGSGASDLALENARLRAELAGLLAQQAAKELGEGEQTAAGPGPAGSVTASQLMAGSTMAARPQAAGGSVGSSVALAASTAATPAAAAAAAPFGAEGVQQASPSAAGAADSGAPVQRPYGHGGPAVVPACVSAPLPSVSAALQQSCAAAQEQATAAASSRSQQVLTLAPVQAALSAKDELISLLESRCGTLTTELSSYEQRISQLEAQLAARPLDSLHTSTIQQQQQSTVQQDNLQQQQTAEQQHDLQQHQHQQSCTQVSSPPTAGVPGQQSVVPAFLLDATQAASFFAPSAAAAAVTSRSKQEQQQQEGAAETAVNAESSEGVPLHPQQQQQQHATQGQQQQDVPADQDSQQLEPAGSSPSSSHQGAAATGQPQPVIAAASTASQDVDEQQQQSEGTTDRDPQQLDTCSHSTTSSSSNGCEEQPHPEAEVPPSVAQGQARDPTVAAAAAAGGEDSGGVSDAKEQDEGAKEEERCQPDGSTSSRAGGELLGTASSGSSQAETGQEATAAPAADSAADSAAVVVDDVSGGGDASGCAGHPHHLSVSEPDLRGVLVAGPAEVEEAHRREGPAARQHRASLDSAAAMPTTAGGSAAAAAAAGGGFTGLLSSSMHYLFHRSSGGGGTSSRGDGSSSSSSNATGSNSSPTSTPQAGSP